MRGLVTALYSAIVYIFFLAVFLYAIGFVEDLVVPKTIDSGVPGNLALAIATNAVLLGVFALQHSIMARPAFKRAWTRIVPEPAERSTYVLFASLALALICWQWRSLPQVVWEINQPFVAIALLAMSWLGWIVVLVSTYLISHFHLFGLSQGLARLLRRTPPPQEFTTPLLYRWLRHPIYAGFILAFWAAPRMSLGHLLFASATTGYIFVGIWFEERDLIAQFGQRYREYRRTVGMLVPKFRTPRAAQEKRAPSVG